MKTSAYMNFDGDCKTAFEFYAKLFGGKILMMSAFGDSPGCEGMPDDARDKIMHARLAIGDDLLMGSDCIPAFPYTGVQGASVALNVDEPADADRIFAALADGGKIEMPIQETFWAKRFGMTTDRFGVPWMVNCEQAS
ncbi:MAG: VOC family protein [Luteimonas sp.]